MPIQHGRSAKSFTPPKKHLDKWLRAALSFWRANFLQAALFALWHRMWPIKYLITGQVSVGGAVVEAATLLVGTSLIGVLYGYLYLKTGNTGLELRGECLYSPRIHLPETV